MLHQVHINIMPLKDLLDPQGKAIQSSLHNVGLPQIQDVRMGKHISLQIEATTLQEAKTIATQACSQLLANAVMEFYEIEA